MATDATVQAVSPLWFTPARAAITATGCECLCTPSQIARYLGRVSGPLLDRFDLHIEVPRVSPGDLITQLAAEPSGDIRTRVLRARERQGERLGKTIGCNAAMTGRQLRKFCRIDEDTRTFLRATIERLGLSARAHDRVLRLARTIADLEEVEAITTAHLAEAIQYRAFDRPMRLLA